MSAIATKGFKHVDQHIAFRDIIYSANKLANEIFIALNTGHFPINEIIPLTQAEVAVSLCVLVQIMTPYNQQLLRTSLNWQQIWRTKSKIYIANQKHVLHV
jgi:hypothetical protein